MFARTENDFYLLLLQHIVRPHDVVEGLNLEIDLLDARLVAREQGHAVMDVVE